MSDGDINNHMTEGTPSATLGTPGSYATMKKVSQEKELLAIQMVLVLIYNLSRQRRLLTLISPHFSCFSLEGSLKFGAGDQDKANMRFLSFDCLSAEEREIVDLKRS